MRENNMTEDFEARAPDYKGDGVAIWKNTDKNKNVYLSVKILGGKSVNCWKYEPKPKEESDV